MKLPINEIICDHNIRAMRKFPDNSIDSILTDPPYGLGFMGKEWDTFEQKTLEKTIEYNRTKRPPRTDGGSKTAFQESTTAGSYDFSRNKEFQKWFTRWAKECLRVAKPGTFMLVFGGTRTFHRLTCAIEDAGWQIRDCLMWLYGSGFPKSHNISKAIDKKAGAKRKVVGVKDLKRGGPIASQTTETSITGWNRPDYPDKVDITIPATDLAQLWDGYGTALKPAWEPIIVAMKPVDGNFAKNAEKYGVAGLNIDGGRIGTNREIELREYDKEGASGSNCGNSQFGKNLRKNMEFMSQGRWPANLIFDEEAAAMLDKQGGENESRFFYIAKASRSERNVGCGGMEKKENKTYGEFQGTLDNASKLNVKKQNFHPTVKPLSLMKYLCFLLKMPNKDQIILDPFMGSGTTCIACKELGINYIGIDKDEDYCKIAKARLKNVRLTLFEKPVKKIKKKVRRRLL